jgi:hypothetical protein
MKMSRNIRFIIVAILLIATRTSASAQRIAVTTNLLEDVALTPNVGVDIVVSDRQSIAFDTSFAPYKISEKLHNKRMTFRAGYKFWLTQAFYAHYIGIDAVASSSDVGIGKKDFKDEYVGLGVGYGYSFIINKRLNIVPGIGVGLAYGKSYEGYDHMISAGNGVQAVSTSGFKPIITRFGVTIQYVLN